MEMTELPADVYDVAYPTPVSLKLLSATTISLEIWRCEVNRYRTEGKLGVFNSDSQHISSKTIFSASDLPPVLNNVIDVCIRRFGRSLFAWLYRHFQTIFCFHHSHRNTILKAFDDFVTDYNGTIHYTRTAERMMHCDRLSKAMKFKIACLYFFEDDIRQIWTSTRKKMNPGDIDFYKCPQLFYWVCVLRNESSRIPVARWNRSVDEVMFDRSMILNRPSVEYFWFRIPLENRLQKAIDLCKRDVVSFLRFIFPKLNNQQIAEFVNIRSRGLTLILARTGFCNEMLFLAIWRRMRNVMSECTFETLVSEMLILEAVAFRESLKSEPKNWFHFCSEIWHSIWPDLKQSMVVKFLSDSKFFETMRSSLVNSLDRRYITYLLIFLSDAASELRETFWRSCWPHLMEGTRGKDLQLIMKLCLETENKIIHFKRFMAEHSVVRRLLVSLLGVAYFDDLNDLVNFMYPDAQTARNFKQGLLRFSLLNENSCFGTAIVNRVQQFSVFVDDTFDSADLSADFKNQLMSSPVIQDLVSCYPCSLLVPFEALMELVDTFVSTEETVLNLKAHMINSVSKYSTDGGRRLDGRVFKKPSFNEFLLWCLGSDEKVAVFKQTYYLPV